MTYPMSPALVHAAKLMEARRFAESGAAYEAIIQTEPHHAAIAACQVGVAHFFLGNYERAIQWYEYAGKLGCDPQMVADNIEEARGVLACETTGASNIVGGGTQYSISEGRVWLNVAGDGWEAYTHPRVGDVILREDGGMWAMSQTGWAPHTADSARLTPPQAGNVVLHIASQMYFVLAADGSWSLRPG